MTQATKAKKLERKIIRRAQQTETTKHWLIRCVRYGPWEGQYYWQEILRL